MLILKNSLKLNKNYFIRKRENFNRNKIDLNLNGEN